MKQFFAFTKKELAESVVTYRLYILLAVFLIFGMMSPLFAKLTPELLKTLETSGIAIQMPEPTAMDSWAQFFKNVGQMGMLVLAISFSGIMASELSKGTLIILLAKGLNRHVVILSKFFASTILWTVSYLACLGICYAYTAYFWNDYTIYNAAIAFAAPWVFGELLLSIVIFGGTLFGNIYGSLLTCLSIVVALNVIGIIPNTAKFNPVTLSGGTLPLLRGVGEVSDFVPAMMVCAMMITALLVGAVLVFEKKEV